MAASYDSNGSSRSRSCFNSDRGYDSHDLAQFANVVLFVAVYLGTLIALFVVRRKTGPGKHLIGLPYIFALSFLFIQQALSFLSFILHACEVSRDPYNMFNWIIASTVFGGLQTFLFLFVVIYTLNTMLRKLLGHNPSALKVVLGLDLFVLGSLLVPYIVLRCYLYWMNGNIDLMIEAINRGFNPVAAVYLGLAFDAVSLVSVIASGVLSLLAARSLKKKHVASGSLVVWILVLILSLVVYYMISIIHVSIQLGGYFYLNGAGYTAMYWIKSISYALAVITIIVIARNPVWKSNTGAAAGHMEQQYAYNRQQGAPVYHGAGQHA